MRIAELIKPELIKLDLQSYRKPDIISEIVQMMVSAGMLSSAEPFLNSVLERESLGTTGIGKGIAIPHGKSDAIDQVVMCFARSKKGVDFEALDGNPVHLIVLLAAPLESNSDYLQALTRLSRFLRHKPFRESLLAAETKDDVIFLLTSED